MHSARVGVLNVLTVGPSLNSRRSLKDVSVSETPYDFGSFGMSAVQFGQGSRFVSTRRATGGFLTPVSVLERWRSGSRCRNTNLVVSAVEHHTGEDGRAFDARLDPRALTWTHDGWRVWHEHEDVAV